MKLLEAPLTLHNSSVPGLTASLVPSIAIGKSGVFSHWEVHTSVVHWLLDLVAAQTVSSPFVVIIIMVKVMGEGRYK
jgi:hypothetical protein